VAELPSRTVTLLFTDVEGSTRLVQLLGEGYGAVLDEHRRLLRRAVAEAGGHEVVRSVARVFRNDARAGGPKRANASCSFCGGSTQLSPSSHRRLAT
jgi:class 3 adenylate cyclase